MGSDVVIGMSKKQKINTKSSTECEVVGVDDALPQMVWTKYFIEAQVYNVGGNIMYQYNLSAMLLDNNGRTSSTSMTKHIRVRYFFINDRVEFGNVGIKNCGKKKMLADHFNKYFRARNSSYSGEK